MRISVALCTYNGEKYIENQLESILKQTCPIDELIIVDDCSSDSTINKIRKIEDSRIKLVRNNENLGYVKNFEKAINLCSNEIIFLSDQDDIWALNKVEEIKQVFKINEKAKVVYSDAIIIDKYNNVLAESLYSKLKNSNQKEGNRRNPIDTFNDIDIKGCLVAFKKEFLDTILPFEKNWGHDHWITILAYITNNLYYLDKQLIYYRRHSEHHGSDDSFLETTNDRKSTSNVLLRRFVKLTSLKNRIVNINLKADNQKYNILSDYLEALRLRVIALKQKKIRIILLLFYKKYYFYYYRGCKSFLKDVFHCVK
ncbi:MAG: glycosyltransferase family 2 protein [Spirochaetaceae bacterium]|nr:glycosyltransferase family 2 protein [Spirochaetaceae bacterium]MCF7938747.1 glycosyltransferase family 2 protein [Spirochaetales bacterium]